MRLTSFTDYSLRVLIYLAAAPERRATIAEIAGAFAIKQNHLTKVVHFLGRQGWIRTVRGKGGGLTLARAPGDIVVGTVVRQTEGADMPAECFDRAHNTCAIARICRLRRVLGRATDAFYAVLDDFTLAELVHNGRAIALMLGIDRTPRATGVIHA
jgi:Rrf2 family transcriptional regulator, nitric oxide-sensitive transcriptional repressor